MNIVLREEKRYPKELAQLKDAPKQLYYRGTWDDALFERCLAVVGTRKMTSYGKRVTEQIVNELAAAGITIVSGFMYGIDAKAHQATIQAGGKTIAVMPCGIDMVHPEYQLGLYQEILESGGLVLSEYEGMHPALSWTFPRRNRIVAGLSKATLVVEAGETSGALITANLAKKYARKVFVVPNPIVSAVSQGVTQLLKEGATPVGGAQDILEYYGLYPAKLKASKFSLDAKIGGELEQEIIKKLQKECLHIDELARSLQVPSSQLASAISVLELEGYIEEQEGKLYAC